MPRRGYPNGRGISAINNLLWNGPNLPQCEHSKAKPIKLPICKCGQARVEYKRLEGSEITEDSHSHFWCRSCGNYTLPEDYSDYEYEYTLNDEDNILANQIRKRFDRTLK